MRRVTIIGVLLVVLLAVQTAHYRIHADTSVLNGGTNAVQTFTSSAGTTEYRTGTLGNAAGKSWWRWLYNGSGGVELQTCSDAGPCTTAQNRLNVTHDAQVATFTAAGLQLTAPNNSRIDAATGTDDASAVVRATVQFPLEGADGGAFEVDTKPVGAAIQRTLYADNNGILTTGTALATGLTRGALALAGPLALPVTGVPAGAVGQVRLYARINGVGKQEIVAVWADNSTAVIATQP